jgi:hypothetical protein
VTNHPDERGSEQNIRRAQQSGHEGYRADSDDELGELDVYEALIDPNGAAGGKGPGQSGGSPMMMPPGAVGGGRGGAGSGGASGAGPGGMGAGGAGVMPGVAGYSAGLGSSGLGSSGLGAGGAGAGLGAGGLGSSGLGAGGLGAGGLGAGGLGAGSAGLAGGWGTSAAGAGAGGGIDTDGDGIADSFPDGGVDTDGDGIPDQYPNPGLDDSWSSSGLAGDGAGPAGSSGIPTTGWSGSDTVSDPTSFDPGVSLGDTGSTGTGLDGSGLAGTGLGGTGGGSGLSSGSGLGSPGSGLGSGGGAGIGSGRGAGSGNITADPDSITKTASGWDQLSTDMSTTSQELQALQASADEFGFPGTIVSPEYSKLQSDMTSWSTNGSKSFATISEQLAKDAQGYRDNTTDAQQASSTINQ